MPRRNRKSPAAATTPKRARSTTKAEPEPEAPSTRPTRGSRSQSKSADDATPKKVTRKTSPSPAPDTRRESRGRSKASKAKEVEEVEQEEPEAAAPKSRQKGKGDVSESRSGSKGRVTRAVVQQEVKQSPRAARGRASRSAVQESEEKEETSPKQRGRSGGRAKAETPKRETPKRTPRKQPEPTASTSRNRSRSARKPAIVEQEDEPEEEEEEEEVEEMEEEEPVPQKKETKGRKKSTPKAKKQKTPSRKSKSPAQRKGRKSDTASPEVQEPQVILTKIETEEGESPQEKAEPKSRRSRSRGKASDATDETDATKVSPSPRSRSSRKKVESVTPKRESRRSRGAAQAESTAEETKEEVTDETKEEDETDEMPVLSKEEDSGLAEEEKMEQEEDKEDTDIASKEAVEEEKEEVAEPEQENVEEMAEQDKEKVEQEPEPVEKTEESAKEEPEESKEDIVEEPEEKSEKSEKEEVMAPEELEEAEEQEELQREEEEEDQLPQQDAIEDISSEEPLEEKQDEIDQNEIEEEQDEQEAEESKEQEPELGEVAMETNDQVVEPEPVLDGTQNGASQEIPTGLVSPSRKRKLDDSEVLDEELSPKKARRSIEVEEVTYEEVKENGGDVPITEAQQMAEVLPQVETESMETEMVAELVMDQAPPVTASVPVPEVVVTEPDGPQEQEIETFTAQAEPVTEVQQDVAEEQDVGKDYVVIDMQDVPASDSAEVLSSIPTIPSMADKHEDIATAQEEPQQVSEPVTEIVQEENIVLGSEQAIQENLVSPPEPAIQEENLVSAPEQAIQEENLVSAPEQAIQEENLVSAPEQVDVNIENAPIGNQKYVESVLPQQIVTDEDSNNISSESDPILNREFIPNPEFEDKEFNVSKQFSVVSYNILAQCHLERNDYSFTQREYLELEYRHNKLMKELQYLDGDIICLQEVEPEYYTNYLEPTMKSLGYEGLMKKRTDDYFAEGEATFYRTSRFTLVTANTYSLTELVQKDVDEAGLDDFTKGSIQRYLNRPDVLVITQLQCNNTGNVITVGNIHVHWGRMEVPDVQSVQIASAIKQVVKTAGSDLSPHILCGDFNSKEASPAYQLTTEGYLGDQMLQTLQNLQNIDLENGSKAALVNHLWGAFQHTSSLKSAYFVTMGCEPDITSYNRVMCATVDYQFYSDRCLDNMGVLETAAEDEVMKTGGIPNQLFPSDHISLKAAFSFK